MHARGVGIALSARTMGTPHVVVLAGGEGNRLVSLTRALYGIDLPKQFAVLVGDKSLLQCTLDRALALTTPDRISVVVTAAHAPIARVQLSPYPGVELVVQPRNLDTAPGILLPIARILARDPHARVVLLPSDHHVTDAAPMRRAFAYAAMIDRVTLIGVEPSAPEVEYGWIGCGAPLGVGPARDVARFVEKPPRALAEILCVTGGLWNTFIQTGPARAFWALARAHLPDHVAAFERYASSIGALDEAEQLAATYATMREASFSRDVLAHARDLAVIPVAGSGWSDWGSPHRVFASLAGTPYHDRLVARMRRDLRAG